jgi:hypothetical protein
VGCFVEWKSREVIKIDKEAEYANHWWLYAVSVIGIIKELLDTIRE